MKAKVFIGTDKERGEVKRGYVLWESGSVSELVLPKEAVEYLEETLPALSQIERGYIEKVCLIKLPK